jgi:uncharacterized membrane protein
VNSIVLAVAASLLLGAVMTAGDFIWAYFSVRHRVYTGVAHGALMCLCIGALIGARAGRVLPGLVAGPIIGVLAAGAFYVLAPTFRWGAMLPAWMLFWICFAVLQRWLTTGTLGMALARGVVAAVVSGLAFYAISGIWTRPAPGGPNYAIHFLYWSFAFLPGFLALFVGHTVRHTR